MSVAGLVLVSTSGCATFEQRDAAAVVNGVELSAELLDGADGDAIRGELQSWITAAAVQQSAGQAVNATPQNAASILQDITLPPLSPETAQRYYDAGRLAVICVLIFPVASEADGAKATALASSSSFAEAAAQFSTEQALAQSGGDPAVTGAPECQAEVGPEILQPLYSVAVGEPVFFPDGLVVVQAKPFATVTPDFQVAIQESFAAQVALLEADVSVGSRFGRWDAYTASVQPMQP
jgi:hypothetical protein